MTQRRRFLVSVGSALAAAATPVGAQVQYPARPIRLVVPFPPGGGADIAARVIAVPLGEALGQPIIVENKAGADGVIASAQLAQVAKLDVVHIPYRGEGPLTADMLAGRVQLMFAAGGPVLPHVRAGKLRALATLLPNRSPLLPEVPTLSEAGVKLSIDPWGGLFGPADLPRDVGDRLNREMVKVLARPEIREQPWASGLRRPGLHCGRIPRLRPGSAWHLESSCQAGRHSGRVDLADGPLVDSRLVRLLLKRAGPSPMRWSVY